MCRHNFKSASVPQSRYPFICRFVPFISSINPAITPLVGLNRPFIWNRGVTLIELIIVLTIAGVLAALAAPSMQKFFASNRLTAQVNDLLADISLARSEATKRNGNVVICKSSNPTAATPACNETNSDPWETGRLVFYDNEDTAASITADNKYETADNDILLRVSSALEGSNTLRPNSSTATVNLANYLTFTKTGLTTLTTPSTTDGPHRFTICDSNNDARAVVLETTGRPRLVNGLGTTFTWSGNTYTVTCP